MNRAWFKSHFRKHNLDYKHFLCMHTTQWNNHSHQSHSWSTFLSRTRQWSMLSTCTGSTQALRIWWWWSNAHCILPDGPIRPSGSRIHQESMNLSAQTSSSLLHPPTIDEPNCRINRVPNLARLHCAISVSSDQMVWLEQWRKGD